jgi:hypothetical protein
VAPATRTYDSPDVGGEVMTLSIRKCAALSVFAALLALGIAVFTFLGK